MSVYTEAELMAATMARLLDDSRHVAVGALSPLPATAALLARTLNPALRVTILGSRKHLAFTDGGRELFDCAAQGRIDTFFLSGVQIDGQANINLVGMGDYDRPTRRFPGSFGSAYLYLLVPKVILFKQEHSPRIFVPKVDFISAAGVTPPNVHRPGGPRHLVTGIALFDFADGRFTLRTPMPGHTVEEIRRETGFEFDAPADDTATVPPPTATELAALRGPVRAEVAEIYPRFAAQAFDGGGRSG
jgi:glutaconate CoA-transferase subunit B